MIVLYMIIPVLVILLLIAMSLLYACFYYEDYVKVYRFRNGKGVKFLNLFFLIVFVVGIILFFGSEWANIIVGDVTPEQIIFNLKSSIKGADKGVLSMVVVGPILDILVAAIMFVFFISLNYNICIYIKGRKYTILNIKIKTILNGLLALFVGLTGSVHGYEKLQLDSVVRAYVKPSVYIEENYMSPEDINLSFPAKKRNLIHIYLESVENTYFSKDFGGAMNENLMPELSELVKEGVSFSHSARVGGPKPTYGSEWSVASMINMGAGIPLKTHLTRNAYGLGGKFLPGVTTLGDILNSQGYNQTIMFGADADFGGLSSYFKSHGDFNIFDFKRAKSEDLIPEDYDVWWGFEDDKLYEYAKDELTRLHETGKPFNFTMETADTHFPDGFLSPNAEEKHDSQYANVISYSTKQAVEFVRWIQEQPFYENTVVVITGDHLSMDKKFFEGFDEEYERTVFNLILNSSVEGSQYQNREYAVFDFFPTIIASMGVDIEGERLGLGTNLFSDEETLLERDGFEYVNDEIGQYSHFYIDNFLGDDN